MSRLSPNGLKISIESGQRTVKVVDQTNLRFAGDSSMPSRRKDAADERTLPNFESIQVTDRER